ncbi:PilT/PilU family type 4a pilus ATPase [Nannocystis sp.]|uniref:type IV pilus twitching motility protein PilT n=1 Tax=Nannocystis sp. TaxID=1962667 RepID=UPI0025FB3EE6|nr:PilT/PilU family type 4a pilus ATPase [Nannocystis sp.]
MAAIDSLLKLVAAQKADAMIVASERVPLLKKGGADVALSMPKVSHDMVAIFLEDLVDAEQLQAIKQGGTLRIAHSVGDEQFSAELNGEGGRFRLAFYLQRPGGPSPARRGTGAPSGRDVTEPHRAGRELGLPVPPQSPVSPQPPQPPQPPFHAAPLRPAVSEAPPRAVLADRLSASESAPPIAYRTASENAGDLIELALQAHRDGASDLLLSTGMPARMRLGGALRETGLTCDAGQILALAELAMTPERRHELERSGSVDLALDLSPGPGARALRFRINLFRQQRGLAAAIRPVRSECPTLAQLGLPDEFRQLVQYPSGLVLMTGPTGSGKSTTLAALIEQVNVSTAKHVITLEDPVELQYVSKRALIHQREVGTDVESFAAGLRAALREDPDIILVGEMRDQDTIAAALTAAETGHLVLSTLHSGSAAMAIDRIIDVFPGPKQPQVRLQLAGSLRAVVTQVLLPSAQLGRVPAYEKMIVTAAVASQIREGRAHQIANQIQTGRAEGMMSLEQSLLALLRAGKVSLEAAMTVAPDPDGLRRAMRA